MSRRKEPTQSIRIRQSDYEILLTLMAQENLQTITDAMTDRKSTRLNSSHT